MKQHAKLGIALGSGAAKGWAHIGVLKALARLGIYPDVVAGCSIGALVGAAYACGQLGQMETWVRGFTRLQVMKLLDWRLDGRGLVRGERVFNQIAKGMRFKSFEELQLPFGVVATEFHTGRELWLQQGEMIPAVRASCAMPGLFVPVHYQGQLLIDGAVVNPVPVTLARALGADVVIAVNLAADMRGYRPDELVEEEIAEESNVISQWFGRLLPEREAEAPIPSMWNVMGGAIDIMQQRITRTRMAGEPPEVELRPRLADISIMEFHRAEEAIMEGERCVERMADFLLGELAFLGIKPRPPLSTG
ncbi:patatin-like phospholipase RssA [Balneatrix alpica]|uniref:Patatin-like phospholipase RssA n=1 Tax=Balneatrix alpica TaxID=75684 RepID=A0ABV5Z9P6_9GAMM|nr:patatin-like phospholipase RssA [Balneatrix alpica]